MHQIPSVPLAASPYKPVLYVFGLLMTVLGVAMLIPGLIDYLAGDVDWTGFIIGGAVTAMIGLQTAFTNRVDHIELTRKQAFLLTAMAWVGIAAGAAFPFVFSRLHLSYTDAFFEAISGLTTTGSTVLAGLDNAPPGILLWRSLLQWLGGIGIIMMAIAMLPFLRVGGMQLFRMESSDTHEKVVSNVATLGWAILGIYSGLTALCGLLYFVGGMTVFEAVNHALTTVSTGGYSTSDASLGHFDSLYINWVAIAFMIAGSLPFALYVRALRGRPQMLALDIQVRAFVGMLTIVVAVLGAWLVITSDMPPATAITHMALNVVSVVTTTGFASTDYTVWGPLAVSAFFALTFVGGCTGSTAGGIKIFRFLVSWRLFGVHVHRLITPHAVEVPRYGGQRITDDVGMSVLLFFFVYVGTVGVLTLFLAALGQDWVTAVSGAATAVSNVGPGLGPIIGPAGNFAALTDAAKWALSAGMLLGRLEFFSLLVLLMPRFWSH